MSQIKIVNLTFSYDDSHNNIFENVSFEIDTNWKLGFIGRNGRGKTTFLKLLLGNYEYSGKILSTTKLEYFPFEIPNKTENTINIINSILNDYEYWQLQKELSLLRVDEDVLYRPFEKLSNGEQIKVMLITLFLKEDSFLLIDEPTNHLDLSARKAVSNYLKSKGGFILASHDRILLDSCVNHILSINKTNIEIQKGNFSSWYKNKNMLDSFEINQNERLKKDIKRLNKSAKEKLNWSNKTESTKYNTRNSGLRPDRGFIGHKSAKMMKRSKCIEQRQQSAIEEKSRLLKNIEKVEKLKITPLPFGPNQMISFNNVSFIIDNKEVCKNINFEMKPLDRIALCGKNGCGKSTILKFILGEKGIGYHGAFKRSNNLKISYIPQDASHLNGTLNDFAYINGLDDSLFNAILKKLDFNNDLFNKDIQRFSAGQKKKILIAKSLSEKANLYIWDEPLNFIDIFSRIQIEDMLLEFKPTILFVEHDESFVQKIATKIIEI